MQNFEFYAPTKVIFGKGTEKEVGRLIKGQGYKKVLLHYGGGSIIKSGLYDSICNSLKEEGISFTSLGGVVPNPRLSTVYEGIELCKKENVDFILAVGGGSVIDSAKAIGYGLANPENDVWDFYSGKAQAKDCMAIGAVLTIAAAGSEMSNSSVITNEDGWLKRGYNHDSSRCKFAVMNPELTFTLPKYQTASGCVDIFMHTMERYFNKDKNAELRDGFSEVIMKTTIRNAKILHDDPLNYDARAEVMWASSFSHNDLVGVRTIGDWACHQLEHELSGMFDVAHGAGLAAIWASWARYVCEEDIDRFVQFAVNVMGVYNKFEDKKATALSGIRAMEEFFQSIDMPISISDMNVNVTEDEIKTLAYKCSFEETRTIGNFKKLAKNDMEKIYEMAK